MQRTNRQLSGSKPFGPVRAIANHRSSPERLADDRTQQDPERCPCRRNRGCGGRGRARARRLLEGVGRSPATRSGSHRGHDCTAHRPARAILRRPDREFASGGNRRAGFGLPGPDRLPGRRGRAGGSAAVPDRSATARRAGRRRQGGTGSAKGAPGHGAFNARARPAAGQAGRVAARRSGSRRGLLRFGACRGVRRRGEAEGSRAESGLRVDSRAADRRHRARVAAGRLLHQRRDRGSQAHVCRGGRSDLGHVQRVAKPVGEVA